MRVGRAQRPLQQGGHAWGGGRPALRRSVRGVPVACGNADVVRNEVRCVGCASARLARRRRTSRAAGRKAGVRGFGFLDCADVGLWGRGYRAMAWWRGFPSSAQEWVRGKEGRSWYAGASRRNGRDGDIESSSFGLAAANGSATRGGGSVGWRRCGAKITAAPKCWAFGNVGCFICNADSTIGCCNVGITA